MLNANSLNTFKEFTVKLEGVRKLKTLQLF